MRQINATSTYKKISDKISNKVNADGKKIVENRKVVDRLFVNGRNSCFIPLKDPKPHFLNNSKIPQLNPVEKELHRISKSILDRTSPPDLIKINLWKDTSDII